MGIPVDYVFDATQHDPDMGVPLLPAETYDFEITHPEVKELGENKVKSFVLGVTVINGPLQGQKASFTFGLWSDNPTAAKISHQQLSAISHVTGVFKIDMKNEGAALRGARFKARIANDGKYNNFKEIMDLNGNKPNKAGSGIAAQQPVAVATPQQFGQAPVGNPATTQAAQWGQPPVSSTPAPTPNMPTGFGMQPQYQQAPVAPVEYNNGYGYAGQQPGQQPGQQAFGGGAPIPPAPPAPTQAPQQWQQQAAPQASSAPWGAPR